MSEGTERDEDGDDSERTEEKGADGCEEVVVSWRACWDRRERLERLRHARSARPDRDKRHGLDESMTFAIHSERALA